MQTSHISHKIKVKIPQSKLLVCPLIILHIIMGILSKDVHANNDDDVNAACARRCRRAMRMLSSACCSNNVVWPCKRGRRHGVAPVVVIGIITG